ncbi:phosphatase [Thermogladius calderae 1633]|uniref:Phosphatase n=1 Tax=Thermogladius calderae (strain DSM 22663 / VKM B-2946 / 1633) TaxID=1184251 RepID=I3TDF1_THEC1|nr:phosphatase PAP2 family protein [Thermogladius calderae]AFK50789.1 phosphatase [Thermogladius calderae 1633]
MVETSLKLVYSLALFGALSAAVLLGLLRGLDYYVYERLRFDNVVVVAISSTASIVFLGVVWIAMAVIDLVRSRGLRVHTYEVAVLLMLSVLLDATLKLIFRVPRPGLSGLVQPVSALMSVEYYSYPSGHATRAVALALYAGKRSSTAWSLAIYTWAFAVCLSRILLGVHWTSDVLGGFAAGLITLYASELLKDPLKKVLEALRLGFVLK